MNELSVLPGCRTFIPCLAALKNSLKSRKNDAAKDNEDEVTHDDRSGLREKGVRRASQSSRRSQRRRRVRS
jgi:hypothetical protein